MTLKQVIVIRRDLNMRKGKMIAQGAHASMGFLLDSTTWSEPKYKLELSDEQKQWAFYEGHTKVVVGCDSEAELHELIARARVAGVTAYPVIDAGRTEFHGVPTLTCAAFGPGSAEALDAITGHLKLL